MALSTHSSRSRPWSPESTGNPEIQSLWEVAGPPPGQGMASSKIQDGGRQEGEKEAGLRRFG